MEVVKTGTGLWFLTGHESQQSSGLSAWGPDQNFLDLNSDWRSWCYQVDTLVSSGGYSTEKSTSHCHSKSPLLFSKQNACLQMQLEGDAPTNPQHPSQPNHLTKAFYFNTLKPHSSLMGAGCLVHLTLSFYIWKVGILARMKMSLWKSLDIVVNS